MIGLDDLTEQERKIAEEVRREKAAESPRMRPTFRVPFCDICQKHVDKFEVHENEIKEEVTLVAYCHGATSEITRPSWEIVTVNTHLAFSKPEHQLLQGRKIMKDPEEKQPMSREEQAFMKQGVL